MLGKGARAHFKHHGGTLAGRVVILLHAVDHALARGEVDNALAANRVGNCAALRRMLALGLNGDRVVAEHIQVALSISLLEQFAALCGRRNRIEHAGVGNSRLGVVRDQLVSVGCDANARIASSNCHESLSMSSVLVWFSSLPCTPGSGGLSLHTCATSSRLLSIVFSSHFSCDRLKRFTSASVMAGTEQREPAGNGAPQSGRPTDKYAPEQGRVYIRIEH